MGYQETQFGIDHWEEKTRTIGRPVARMVPVESALQLNLNCHILVKPFHSSSDSSFGDVVGFNYVGLDYELACWYSRLKSPPAKPWIIKFSKPQISDKKENNETT